MNEHGDHMTCTFGNILQRNPMLRHRPSFPLNINLQHYPDDHYTSSSSCRKASVVCSICKPLTSTSIRLHYYLFITYNSCKTLAEREITVELLIVNVAIPLLSLQNPSKHRNRSGFIQAMFLSSNTTTIQSDLSSLRPSPQNTEKLIWWLWIASLRYTAISDAQTSSFQKLIPHHLAGGNHGNTRDIELNPKHTRLQDPSSAKLVLYWPFCYYGNFFLFSRIRGKKSWHV